MAGCASPVAPSGGPEDTTPPALDASEPAAGAVLVRADRLVLTFSEGVDEATVGRALSVAPGWAVPPEVRARGRRVEVLFPDSLRANTTYVVTLDTNLRDLRGVALRQPITLAFATGPTLDRGRIAGRVLDPQTGRAAPGLDVFAYVLPDSVATMDSTAHADALPDPTTTAPDYRTQTGPDGAFVLDYLRPGPFFVVAVADGVALVRCVRARARCAEQVGLGGDEGLDLFWEFEDVVRRVAVSADAEAVLAFQLLHVREQVEVPGQFGVRHVATYPSFAATSAPSAALGPASSCGSATPFSSSMAWKSFSLSTVTPSSCVTTRN